MKVSVRGTGKLSKKETKTIVKHLAEHFLGKRLANNLSVTVIYCTLPPNYRGYYGPMEDEEGEETPRPREFCIWISETLGRPTTIKTIIHEMVHVWRTARNEFRVIGHDCIKWFGETYHCSSDEKDYRKRPWEKECHKFEKTLYKQVESVLKCEVLA